MDIEKYIKDLSPELQEKARGCGSIAELSALARDNDIPLPDEAVAAIAGGDNSVSHSCSVTRTCPKCHSKDIECTSKSYLTEEWHCNHCNNIWWVQTGDG